MPVRAKRAVAALGMLLFLAFYIWAVIAIGERLPDHPMVHLAFYGLSGILWGIPLFPLMSWAEREPRR